MKCPYQTITITEQVKAMAIGNSDYIKTQTIFTECLYKKCPAYYEELVDDKYGLLKEAVCHCKRVEGEQ